MFSLYLFHFQRHTICINEKHFVIINDHILPQNLNLSIMTECDFYFKLVIIFLYYTSFYNIYISLSMLTQMVS